MNLINKFQNEILSFLLHEQKGWLQSEFYFVNGFYSFNNSLFLLKVIVLWNSMNPLPVEYAWYLYYLYSPTDEEIWEEIMQEVREEQARRKAEGKTAKYKSLKKRSRKHGCSSDTDIAAEEDKKKAENNAQLVQTLLLRKI